MRLTPEQEAIINFVKTSHENLAVAALAGSGKTFTLMEICKHLDRDDKVIAIAFNKTIANELTERMPHGMSASTMNSLGHRAWAGYLGKRLYLEQNKIGKIVRGICNVYPDYWDNWISICRVVEKAKRSGLVPEHIQREYKTEGLVSDNKQAWLEYMSGEELSPKALGGAQQSISLFEEILSTSIEQAFDGTIDYDDQIYMSVLFNGRVPKYDTVLVDEAQDLSYLQHALIDKMVDDSTRLIIVGDFHQAIYGFRGASSESLKELIRKYKCVTLPLTTCFRCPELVVNEAKQYVPEIRAAEGANKGVVESLLDWSPETIQPNSAIICRNVAPLVRTTYRLIASGKPAKMMGRDIGKNLVNLINKLSDKANIKIDVFIERLEDWKTTESQIARAKGDTYYEESVYDKADAISAVRVHSNSKCTNDLIKSIETLFVDQADRCILLSTIHKAKGFEWDTVYFLDKWRIPSKHAKKLAEKEPNHPSIKQEYNLAYVATTRAKNKLFYLDSNNYKGYVGEEDEVNFLATPDDQKAGKAEQEPV